MYNPRRLAVTLAILSLLAGMPCGAAAQPASRSAPTAPDSLEPLRVALAPLLDGGQVTLGTRAEEQILTVRTETLFLQGTDTWAAEGRDLAVEIARALTTIPATTWRVEAHTDSSGSSGFNERLSQLRADQMKQLMVSEGIVAKRIVASGLGESQPVAPNTTAEGQASNRRLEILWR